MVTYFIFVYICIGIICLILSGIILHNTTKYNLAEYEKELNELQSFYVQCLFVISWPLLFYAIAKRCFIR